MERALRNLLWPRYTASAPSLINRIGRVLHWTIAGSAAAVFVMLAIISAAPWSTMVAILLGMLLAGRAIRYILSAE